MVKMNMKHWLSIALILIPNLNCNVCDKMLAKITYDPDEDRTPCQLIESRNFKCDTHWAKTADGYIIALHRVINPILKASKKQSRPVVLQHGLIGSSLHWLMPSAGGFAADWTNGKPNVDLNVEGRNLPYLLANYGYDVWMPNSRGCQFSQNHTFLDPEKDSDFWKFSFDEMIIYDSPAVIDYILLKTGNKKLDWIGVSQGAMVMFGLLAEKPEYSTKINLFCALAPAVYIGHATTPVLNLAKLPVLLKIASMLNIEFKIPKSILDTVAEFCDKAVQPICELIFESALGKNPKAHNSSRLLVYLKQGPCPTSCRNMVHYGYNFLSQKFNKFNHGWLENLARYWSVDPPEYNLAAINLKNIVLMYSDNDIFVPPEDIKILEKAVKVPMIVYRVKDKNFGHADFGLATNVYEMVNIHIIKYLKQFN